VSFRQQARAWAKGLPLTNPPEELTEYKLLTALPGYTLALLEAEPAHKVQRWLMIMDEIAREEQRQANRAKRR
jgi:hypothetical protein